MSIWWMLHPGVLAAMQSMDDQALSEENGAGLAFPFENFRFELEKTSFIQLTGSATNLCTSGTSTPAGCTTFTRGDLRYYGLSMSRGTTGGPAGTVTTSNVTDWFGNGCTAGTFGLGCPLSTDAIINYSNFDNPFMLRVFNYTGIDTAGLTTSNRPVLELLGPSNMDAFRWSFFGEVESGRTYGATASNGLYPITGATCAAGTGSACLLQLQNIILGKPASRLKPPSVGGIVDASNPWYGPALRLFQYAGTTADAGANPATYGIQYESRLSGNYRMSVNTTAAGAAVRGVVPDFTDEEGLYFMNVQAYLPLGQLHYQALVFDDTQPGSSGAVTTNGNISIEVSRLPNNVPVRTDFYSFVDGTAGSADSGYNRVGRSNRYYQTHGYVEWGDKFPDTAGGVSTVRFAGVDPDGATRAINSTNFDPTYFRTGRPSYVDGAVAPSACSGGDTCSFTWLYSGANVGDAVVAGSRNDVIGAGGMSFVSKNSSTTWQVLNNQNMAQNNTAQPMMFVVNTSTSSTGNWNYRHELQRDARYPGTTYNPMLNVNAINLGHSRVSGLLIQHMKIETLGGQ